MAEKIVIIDDEVETIRLITLVLQKQGFQVVSANDGNSGLALVKKEIPDLVLLDIMMPDIDGYQVTRQLRQSPDTAHIPILIFSAKSQVEDRVNGFESGIDDYLSKPVHPAELVARIKALISRAKKFSGTPNLDTGKLPQGHTIGVLAAKGGLGVSTFVLNLSLSLHQKSKKDIIAAELNPGHGSWTQELGLHENPGLCRLLSHKGDELNRETVENELLRTIYGITLLTASNKLDDIKYIKAAQQFEYTIRYMAQIAPLVLLDLGDCRFENNEQILGCCQELIVLTDSYQPTILRTKSMLAELQTLGFGKSKIVSTVLYNRMRVDSMPPLIKVQEMLGKEIAQMVSPAPELAYMAAQQNKPMTIVQPESLVSQQINQFALTIANRITES